MQLELARDFEAIKDKYRQVSENTPEMDRYARWIYGQHPTESLLQKYLEEGELYVLRDGTEIAGMMAVVMYQGQDYEAVS